MYNRGSPCITQIHQYAVRLRGWYIVAPLYSIGRGFLAKQRDAVFGPPHRQVLAHETVDGSYFEGL